jgi:hypothetical protein
VVRSTRYFKQQASLESVPGVVEPFLISPQLPKVVCVEPFTVGSYALEAVLINGGDLELGENVRVKGF